jgi:hypothetical protein
MISFKDTNDAGESSLTQTPSIESDEEYDYFPRSTPFLRFGRQLPSSSGAFLRFGRSSSNFLRFGRSPSNFLRFGPSNQNGETFPRFDRFGRKGEFLRFG